MSSESDITVERAETDDVHDLTKTCKRAFDSDSEIGAPGPGGPPGYDSIEWNTRAINNQYLKYYKIMSEEQVVGGFIAGNRGPGYQVCERIWVDPDYMRRGIGGRTFELVWEKYPSADLWTLGTPEWNTRTNPFYKKLGFVQIGITRDHPTWNGIYYEKRLIDRTPRALSEIDELQEGQQRVVVEGLIEEISPSREFISKKTGKPQKVADAKLVDDTGSITLVLWNDQIRQVTEGSKIRTEEGFVKVYRGKLQLGIGKWGMIITLCKE